MRLRKKEILNRWNLNLRPGKLDLDSFQEDDYEVCHFHPQDRWLDLGSNVGSFGLKYYDRVERIVSVEADLENYEHMLQNYQLNQVDIVTIRGAVVGDNTTEIDFYPCSSERDSMAHSTLPIRGRQKVTVPAVNIDTLIQEHNINKLKVDIEGSEWNVLTGMTNWEPIQEIIFEFHKGFLKDKDDSMFNHIIRLLTDKGFLNQTHTKKTTFNEHRMTIVHCWK